MKRPAKLNQSLLYQAAKNYRSGPIEGKKFITNENKEKAVADIHRMAEDDTFADAILDAFPGRTSFGRELLRSTSGLSSSAGLLQ